MEREKLKLIFTKRSLTKEFILQKPSSVIIIRTAFITNLLDKNEWFTRRKDCDLYFEFSSSKIKDSQLIHPRVNFMQNIVGDGRNPIFEFSCIVPQMNWNNEDSENFCRNVKITLEPETGLSDNDEISVFGEYTDGVIFVE